MTVNNHIFALALLGLVWIPLTVSPIAPKFLIIFSFVIGFIYSSILIIRRKQLSMTPGQTKVIAFLLLCFLTVLAIFLEVSINPNGGPPDGMPL